MWVIAVRYSRYGRFAARHDIRKYTQRRNSPSVVLDVYRFSGGNTIPIFDGIPSPKPNAVFQRIMFPRAVHQHKPRVSAIRIQVFGRNDNGRRLFGGLDVSEMKNG